jgi:hypothetical protein
MLIPFYARNECHTCCDRADGGLESSAFTHWLSWPSRFWSVGTSLSETIFDAGLRRATVQQYVVVLTGVVLRFPGLPSQSFISSHACWLGVR